MYMEDFLDKQERISNQILELLQTHGGYLSKKKLTELLEISGNSLRIYLKNIEVRLESFVESGHVFLRWKLITSNLVLTERLICLILVTTF